jgi:putative ABC transport system permease protein
MPTWPGILWRIAANNLRRSVHRNAITVAALAAAIAMMTGLTVMIYSFRQSVDAWIHRGIVADLYISPASTETVGRRRIHSSLRHRLAESPPRSARRGYIP